MRTIKASEVRKGMRVRVEFEDSEQTIQAWEGTIAAGYGRDTSGTLSIGSRRIVAHPDHPVTVLAEPEPEWVEGAWYWVSCAGEDARPLRRVEDGWTYKRGDDSRRIICDEERVTVLGRVLIVDWPGDDVARAIERSYTPGGNWIATENTAAQIIADALRTQGGAR